MKVIVVGGGVYGLSGALELRRRGHVVSLYDRSPLPAPDASSNDLSRIIRFDYGDDAFFTRLAHRALLRWRTWNDDALSEGGGKLFHEVGIVLLTNRNLEEGQSYEGDSYRTVQREVPHAGLERLEAREGKGVGRRFPGWAPGGREYPDGYFNPTAGWANAGETVTFLARKAMREGVEIRTGKEGEIDRLISEGGKVKGIRTADGKEHYADLVIVAAGAWSPSIVPELQGLITAVGHPVVYLQVPPTLREKYLSGNFPVFATDIARTGKYGFPLDRHSDLLKIGDHGKGYTFPLPSKEGGVCSTPLSQPRFPPEEIENMMRFVSTAFPELAKCSPRIVKTRICWYCDSWDSYYYIDHVPNREGLMVACGTSGHGFKFAPVMGEIIADAAERRANEEGKMFRWREPGPERRAEACRMTGGEPGVLSML